MTISHKPHSPIRFNFPTTPAHPTQHTKRWASTSHHDSVSLLMYRNQSNISHAFAGTTLPRTYLNQTKPASTLLNYATRALCPKLGHPNLLHHLSNHSQQASQRQIGATLILREILPIGQSQTTQSRITSQSCNSNPTDHHATPLYPNHYSRPERIHPKAATAVNVIVPHPAINRSVPTPDTHKFCDYERLALPSKLTSIRTKLEARVNTQPSRALISQRATLPAAITTTLHPRPCHD